ncbi:MAG TPA: UDP-4-amino-4,6-dideoxy-N-acetyl-beta-L-altrosamine transaminase, partial [Treponema sp.]|nr:UDP-4-amino-4,6-dideoxy-N-acetyl-beta-L-altrosamine transaminase [Treponema sp.]
HLYLIRVKPEKLTIGRDEFARELQKKGIGISVHFIPLFRFTYWKELYPSFTAQNYPNAENQYVQTISIPLWPDMTDGMAEEVIQAVKETGETHHA